MTADPTGPLAERIARALFEQENDGTPRLPSCALRAADLLRRAGISEPAGLVWEVPDWGGCASAPTPFGLRYNVCEHFYDLWGATFDGEEIVAGTFPDEVSARAACEADYAARMLAAWPVVAAEVERREADIRILLAQLDYLREATGEGVEGEDAALVEGIRASLPAIATPPAPVVASPLATTAVDDSGGPSGSDNADLPARAISARIEWRDPESNLITVGKVYSDDQLADLLTIARDEVLEEAAKAATSFLVGDPEAGVPLRSPLAHEIAARIRALKFNREGDPTPDAAG